MRQLKKHKYMLAVLVVTILTACGNQSGSKNSQSIVQVNEDEITVHQVNFQMQRMQVNEKNKDAVAKQVISGLVDRQLLVQEALKSELDRNPQVMQALEESRMQLLAKAYLENKVANIVKPTDAEVSDYRSKNPELFENRKLYAIEELNFSINAALDAELDRLSNTAKSLEDVTAWLDANQIKYSRNKAVRAAESIPPTLIKKISQLHNGELLFLHGPNGYSVALLLETKSQTIGVAESKPIIERLLLNERQKAAAIAEMERLRKAAKVVYIDKKFEAKQQVKGDVKSMTPQGLSTEVSNPLEGKTVEGESADTSPVDAATQSAKEKKINASVEKGLSGL